MLQQYLQLAIDAHKGVSFSPEKRGHYYIKEYSQLLEADIESLKKAECTEGDILYYTHKFKSLFAAWMSRKCSCISSMIAGPSKFPTRRAEKANQREDNAYKVFDQWRTSYFKKLNKSVRPSNPDEELEDARKRLSAREKDQAHMKQVNALCRKKNAAELLKSELGLSDSTILALLNPRYMSDGIGYPRYKLTNNGAMIRSLTKRVEMLEEKIDLREKIATGEKEVEEWAFDGGRVFVNREIDRVQILHDHKPEKAVIKAISDRGFSWSPSNIAWQRKITPQAIIDAKRLMGIQ
jgi:hypothetical protein